MGLIIGGVSAHDLILDGQSVSLYAGGSPPVKVWPTREKVQITLGTGTQARVQLLAALADRGLGDYETVTEIPFDIELVGTGWAQDLFAGYYALTTVPAMDTSGVTQMGGMFWGCEALKSVPDMDTSQVTNMGVMFFGCEALTSVPSMDTAQVTAMDGMFQDCYALTTVPEMDTAKVADMRSMFDNCSSLTHVPDLDTSSVTDMGWMFYFCSSLTHVPDLDASSVTNMRSMFHGCSSLTWVPDLGTSSVTNMTWMFRGCAALTDGDVRLIGRNPQVDTTNMILNSGLTREPWYTADGRPVDVYEVSLTDVRGNGTVHPLVSVTVPAGQVWDVQIQGTVTKASSNASNRPQFRIGASNSAAFEQGASVNFSGTVSSANATIAMVTRGSFVDTSFTGTVTIEK